MTDRGPGHREGAETTALVTLQLSLWRCYAAVMVVCWCLAWSIMAVY